MAPALTTTSYAVLGLLSVRSWTTYELAQQVERSLGWFWPRTSRKIYDEAKRLVDAGLAGASAEMTGRRPRTVYDISDDGRDALAIWLGGPSDTAKFESEAVVKIFFADGGSLEQLQSTLQATADEAQQRHDVLLSMIDSMGVDDYRFVHRRHLNMLALRFGLDNHRALADWARWALRQTQEWTSTEDPGEWQWQSAIPESPGDGPLG